MEDFQFSKFFMSLYLQVFLKKDYSISSVTREKVTLSFSVSSMQSQRLIFKIHIASYLLNLWKPIFFCFLWQALMLSVFTWTSMSDKMVVTLFEAITFILSAMPDKMILFPRLNFCRSSIANQIL